MNPPLDNHAARYQLITLRSTSPAPVPLVVFTSKTTGRQGFEDLVAFVHETYDMSLLHATMKCGYSFRLVA